MFFYPSKKHKVSPTAKKIMLQLPSKKTQSQKMIKNLNISLKYTRNTDKLLEFFLTPKGNCADGLCRLKITLLGKCEGRHTAKVC